MKWALLLLFFVGCNNSEYQDFHDEQVAKILAEDRDNKELELIYLEEIMTAQENNDTEAFDFYMKEYMNVPRIKIPEYLKKDKRYFIGGRSLKY
jgi:hypothetical protein